MKASKVQLKAPTHVWEGRIPAGGLTYIVGPSSAGKSTLAMRLAADLTTGALTGTKENLVMMMLEDSDSEVNIPRFKQSGGDLNRLEIPDENDEWTFPRDTERLVQLMKKADARVVIIDPMTSVIPNLGNQTARHTLDELHRAAEKHGFAIVFLHHFIKGAANVKTVKEAISGGHHVYNLARSILVFGWEPHETGRMILAHEKMSGDALQKSLVFSRRIVAHPSDGNRGLAVLDNMQEEVEYTALDVIATQKEDKHAKGLGEARKFIIGILASEGGMTGQDLKGIAVEAGFSGSMFHRARAELAKGGRLSTHKQSNGDVLWAVIPEEDE